MPTTHKMTLFALACGLLLTAWLQNPAPAPSETLQAARQDLPVPAQRALDLLMIEPNLGHTERRALIAASDRVRRTLQALGEEDVGQAVLSRLAEARISQDEARAYYERHRELFGRRSFEASSWTIRQLIAIERTRAELGIER